MPIDCMDMLNLLSLLAIMLVLAAVPSASVGLVVTRSVTHGLRSGLAASAGIVVADLCFVLMAILGMTALAELLGSFFVVIRLIAGGYLIWLGVGLLRSVKSAQLELPGTGSSGMATSFAAGFLLTLGDVKAIFFYASLFPAFIDLTRLTAPAVLGILLVTALSVGGVKAAYALSARLIARRIHSRRLQRAGKLTAGGLMVGAGTWLMAKS